MQMWLLTEMLEIVLTPTILCPGEIGSPRLFSLRASPRLTGQHPVNLNEPEILAFAGDWKLANFGIIVTWKRPPRSVVTSITQMILLSTFDIAGAGVCLPNDALLLLIVYLLCTHGSAPVFCVVQFRTFALLLLILADNLMKIVVFEFSNMISLK